MPLFSSRLLCYLGAALLLANLCSCQVFFDDADSTSDEYTLFLEWSSSSSSSFFFSYFVLSSRLQNIFIINADLDHRYETLSDTSEVKSFIDEFRELISLERTDVSSAYTDDFPFKSSYENNEAFVDALLENDEYLTPTVEELFENAYSSSSALLPTLGCLAAVSALVAL